MKKTNILFICDVETTGLDPDKDYPIELGGIFVDRELNGICTFNTLILPPEKVFAYIYREGFGHDDEIITWKEEYVPAFKVHGITPQELKEYGASPEETVNKLLNVIDHVLRAVGSQKNSTRIIITSDNAQFEFRFIKRLFRIAGKESDFPFHYAAWDVNLCLQLLKPEIGDAIPVHRALPDALRIYRQLIRYAERTGFFQKLKPQSSQKNS